MSVPFLDARLVECHTPRWSDATPMLMRMVCGAPTLPGKSYCADCRKVLIAGVFGEDGRPRWFNPPVGARWRKPASDAQTTRATPVHVPDDDVITDDAEEAEPEGACHSSRLPDARFQVRIFNKAIECLEYQG